MAREDDVYLGGIYYVGSPGAWARHELPESAERIALSGDDHGVALSRLAMFATDDGGESWWPVVDDTQRDIWLPPLRCSSTGCIADGLAIYGVLPEGAVEAASREPSNGSEDAVDVPEGTWSYAYHRWRCAPPAHTQWHDDQGLRHATPWGWIDDAYLPEGQTEISWTAVDARGIARMHGALPAIDGHIERPLVTTRRFAVASTTTGLVVLAARSSAIDLSDLAPWYDSSRATYETAVLANGEALVLVVDDDDTRRPRAELLLHFDADGAMVGSHTYWWRGRLARLYGVAAGPGGVFGRAMISEEEATWLVYPMDGSDPISLPAPAATEACGPGTRPWSITTPGGPIEMAYESTGYVAANVFEIGDGHACTSAVLPQQVIGDAASYGLFLPALFGEAGAIRALAADDSARGVTLQCSLSTD